MSEQISIAGGWLGTYAYQGPPTRFEATFTPALGEGRFSGTILDDGRLGEANATGSQTGREVRFVKLYLRPGMAPVAYQGTLSEDGRTLTGTWRIGADAQGIWDAHRLWSEAADNQTILEEAAETGLVTIGMGG
jgi:hypothetical protein